MLTKLIRAAVSTIQQVIERNDAIAKLERLSDRQLADMGLERASLRQTIRMAMLHRDARANSVANAEVLNALWAFDDKVLAEPAANANPALKQAKVA